MTEQAPNQSSGIAEMERRSDESLDQIQKQREQEQHEQLKAEQKRLAGEETEKAFIAKVEPQNARAALEIYGRTETKHHQENGQTVSSTVEHKGILDEIASNPKYGKTPEERNTAVQDYKSQLEQLQSEHGLELSQAKLVMDLRNQRKERRTDPSQEQQYKELDKRTIARIKDGQIASRGEWDNLSKKPDSAEESTDDLEIQDQDDEFIEANQDWIDELNEKAEDAGVGEKKSKSPEDLDTKHSKERDELDAQHAQEKAELDARHTQERAIIEMANEQKVPREALEALIRLQENAPKIAEALKNPNEADALQEYIGSLMRVDGMAQRWQAECGRISDSSDERQEIDNIEDEDERLARRRRRLRWALGVGAVLGAGVIYYGSKYGFNGSKFNQLWSEISQRFSRIEERTREFRRNARENIRDRVIPRVIERVRSRG